MIIEDFAQDISTTNQENLETLYINGILSHSPKPDISTIRMKSTNFQEAIRDLKYTSLD